MLAISAVEVPNMQCEHKTMSKESPRLEQQQNWPLLQCHTENQSLFC